jgi:L-aminopeptidase/D-esterase-like protein
VSRERGPRSKTLASELRIGHATSVEGTSGVTALLFGRASPTVIDVRGGAAATFDTASLSPEATFGRRWALFFSGGSVFGLDAGAGVRARVLEEGGGHSAFRNPHRIAPISGAALFDLPRTESQLPDYQALGYEAAASARTGRVETGRVGAGAGATVGKYRGRESASPGGLGSATGRVGTRGQVTVLAVVNSVGAIRDPANGVWRSGARGPGGQVIPPTSRLGRTPASRDVPLGTTLISVVTDVSMDRRALQRVAILAHTGLSRCVDPVHTATDGDVVFATTLSGGPLPSERYPGEVGDTVGIAASELVVRAVICAVGPPSKPRRRGSA